MLLDCVGFMQFPIRDRCEFFCRGLIGVVFEVGGKFGKWNRSSSNVWIGIWKVKIGTSIISVLHV